MGGCLCCKRADVIDEDDIKIYQLSKVRFEEVGEPKYLFTKAKVIKVYDGDTFWIAAWQGNEIVRYKVRLYGVDCPEIRGGTEESKRKAQESKEYVVKQALGKIVDITVLNNIKDKYGRLLAKIRINGVDLTYDLITKGLGVPYFGGKKSG